ncbi:MAG: ankyrin repeat domain-containing protein [Propionibacteriaceae bacterium]|nr:ankyrin repeat domain-containing protein [Propionibacteriaceae bacterium]
MLRLVVVLIGLSLALSGCSTIFSGPDPSQWWTSSQDLTLAKAVAAGEKAEISRLIRDGANPNAIGIDGITMLQWSATARSLDGMAGLLEMGATPDLPGKGGEPPLHSAAWTQPAMVELLLQAGSDPDVVRAATGTTALKIACLQNDEPVFTLLVDAGADVDWTDPNRGRPIDTCASTQSGALVLRLLELGANPHSVRKDGSTFQDRYFILSNDDVSDRVLQERAAIIAWLDAHDVPVHPKAYQ